MKCQTCFMGKNKKNVIKLSSAELAQRVVKVQLGPSTLEIQYIAVRYFAISSISRIVRGPQIYHDLKKKKNK